MQIPGKDKTEPRKLSLLLLVIPIVACGLTPRSLASAAESPEALVRAAVACDAKQACLAGYVADPIYFPQVRELKTAGPECAAAYTAAKERDGYGWYLTGSELLDCLFSATEAFPGSSLSPRAAFEQCLVDPVIENKPAEDLSRLVGKEFFCELERQGGAWRITQLVQKP